MKQFSKVIITAGAAVAVAACATQQLQGSQIKEAQFKSEYTADSQMVKAQYYRWFQLYERPMSEQRIANQMALLTDDVLVKNAVGEMRGKDNYPARVVQYKGWKNAHHVENISVVEQDGAFDLEADIRYQNIQPDGKQNSYTLHYVSKLVPNSTPLPVFSAIDIQPTGATKEAFSDAYMVNRTKSLMYYWLGLMEQLDGDVEPFKELLSDGFQLNFSTKPITSYDEFQAWHNGIPAQLAQSAHYPENFSVTQVDSNHYQVTVDFDWYGILKNGKKMRARTEHTWQVVDDPEWRFARISRVDVKQAEPFRVVE